MKDNINNPNLGDILSGMSEDKAELWMLENLGEIPSFWNDPITRSELLGDDAGVFFEAHLNQFEQAYGGESRHGTRARAIGDLRNVDGQGMPGEAEWRRGLKGK